jgi:hypothetical protein
MTWGPEGYPSDQPDVPTYIHGEHTEREPFDHDPLDRPLHALHYGQPPIHLEPPPRSCFQCGGSGSDPADGSTCPVCGGWGMERP